MILISLLLLSALALASAAGYFSVSGLAETYAASFISVIIMGSCLEASKLVLASFIHKFWSHINFIMKFICCSMLGILMFITSYGVFSHLTSAYQKDSVPLTEISQKLDQDKTELARLLDRKSQMDDQIAKLPNSYVKARGQLIKSFGTEYTSVPKRIDELNAEISDLNSKQLTTQAKIGPIIYLAKVLGKDADLTIFYFTLLITLTFDPLAVNLMFAFNIALSKHRENAANKKLEDNQKLSESTDLIKYHDSISNATDIAEHIKPDPPNYSEKILGDMYAKLKNKKGQSN